MAVDSCVPWLEDTLQRHIGFWSGVTPPAAVAREDAWKCSFCHFRPGCQAGVFYTAQGLCY